MRGQVDTQVDSSSQTRNSGRVMASCYEVMKIEKEEFNSEEKAQNCYFPIARTKPEA